MSLHKTLLAAGLALGVTIAGFCDPPSPIVVHSGYVCGKQFIIGLTIHADGSRTKISDATQALADCKATGKLCIVTDICALAGAWAQSHGAQQSNGDKPKPAQGQTAL